MTGLIESYKEQTDEMMIQLNGRDPEDKAGLVRTMNRVLDRCGNPYRFCENLRCIRTYRNESYNFCPWCGKPIQKKTATQG